MFPVCSVQLVPISTMSRVRRTQHHARGVSDSRSVAFNVLWTAITVSCLIVQCDECRVLVCQAVSFVWGLCVCAVTCLCCVLEYYTVIFLGLRHLHIMLYSWVWTCVRCCILEDYELCVSARDFCTGRRGVAGVMVRNNTWYTLVTSV